MGMLGEFISKGVTGAATSGPSGVSSLSHKVRENAVEYSPIIESLAAEEYKVVDRYRNIAGE